MPGLDPFKLTTIVEKQVARMKNEIFERRYYRFRGGRWYGGIATGDVVGCNLRCKFCWSWRYSFYGDKGWFETPTSVFHKLESIAEKGRYEYLRLSGGEPTIAIEHLYKILDLVEESKYTFILETNGLLIGKNLNYAENLVNYSRLVIRVSFKGCTPQEFEYLTGARAEFYEYQFKALENLAIAGGKPCRDFYPAVMLSFSSSESYMEFKKKLMKIHPTLTECIDEEYVILYPHVIELLKRNKLTPKVAYKPNGVPDFMI